MFPPGFLEFMSHWPLWSVLYCHSDWCLSDLMLGGPCSGCFGNRMWSKSSWSQVASLQGREEAWAFLISNYFILPIARCLHHTDINYFYFSQFWCIQFHSTFSKREGWDWNWSAESFVLELALPAVSREAFWAAQVATPSNRTAPSPFIAKGEWAGLWSWPLQGMDLATWSLHTATAVCTGSNTAFHCQGGKFPRTLRKQCQC